MTAYGSLSTRFYDLCFPEAPSEALAFYAQYARDAQGPILEPMCGSGRYLLPLLEQGFDIDGCDASDEMLERCRARAKTLGHSTLLRRGLVQSLEVKRQYALVMIPAGSFCLLTDPNEAAESLRRVFNALLPGGTFVVEIERAGFLTPTLDSTWNGRWLKEPDGAIVAQSVLHQYSGVEGIARALHRYELISGGRLLETEFEEFAVKHYERGAFTRLLEEAGFRQVACYVPHERRPPCDDDEGLLFECRKA
jgi:SAM-dependent methyltransferase